MLALLIIIPIVAVSLILLVHYFFYDLTKKYYYLAFISLFIIVYFLIFRYIPDLQYLIKKHIYDLKNINTYQYSFYFSKALLLDMCPLLTFLIPFTLILDKSKNIAKCLAPVGLIGAVITLFGGVILDQDDTIKNLEWKDFYKYLFLGIANDESSNRIYFLMHLFLLCISLLTLLNAKQYTKWSIIGTIIFFIGYLIYAIVLIKTLSITNNVSGLVKEDWYGIYYNQYGAVYNFLPISFPGIVIFWYFIVAIVNLIICYIKNLLTTDLFKLSRCNNPFYSKLSTSHFIYQWLSKIDHTLNFFHKNK